MILTPVKDRQTHNWSDSIS